MTDALEQTAEQIAEKGRDALLDRLRPAFREAASAHADALVLDEDELEQMVQRAADAADGLQWRRALAAVATEQLGIGLGEALAHPAVTAAHEMLGVPSYEEGLRRLRDQPALLEGAIQAEPSVPAEAFLSANATHPAEAGVSANATHPAEASVSAEGPLGAEDEQRYAAERTQNGGDRGPEPVERYDSHTLRLRGVHLGGIADLASPEPGVELWFSDEGLDIIRPTKEPLGRLRWEELRAVEVPLVRGRFGRRRNPRAYLVIRGDLGDASFEIPGVTPHELRGHLAPILAQPM